MKKLYRSEKDKMIAGVCAGLAEYLNMDPTLIRVIFLIGLVLGFSASFWVYVGLWVFVPTESMTEETSDKAIKSNIQEIKLALKKLVNMIKSVVKN